MQLLSYVRCFIGFTFAFEIDHIQQGGERIESVCVGGRGSGGAVTHLTPALSLVPADHFGE